MKANAPEKIYINGFSAFATVPVKEGVEYIRTDAFIEKAKKWFEKQNEWFDLDGNRQCDMESFEDFVNYMEEE